MVKTYFSKFSSGHSSPVLTGFSSLCCVLSFFNLTLWRRRCKKSSCKKSTLRSALVRIEAFRRKLIVYLKSLPSSPARNIIKSDCCWAHTQQDVLKGVSKPNCLQKANLRKNASSLWCRLVSFTVLYVSIRKDGRESVDFPSLVSIRNNERENALPLVKRRDNEVRIFLFWDRSEWKEENYTAILLLPSKREWKKENGTSILVLPS